MPYLNATTDIAFKKLFGEQKHIALTIDFLNNLLERTEGSLITTATIKPGEMVPLLNDGKQVFFDVYCIDQQGKHYIVEVQKQDRGNFIPRAQFYVANSLSRQLAKNGKYEDLMPVIFVGVVVNFNLFHDTPDFLSHHATVDLKTGKQSHFHTEYHYLELKKFTKQEHELVSAVDKWSFILKNAHELEKLPISVQGSHELTEAFDVLEQATWSYRELDYYRAEQELLNKDEELQRTAAKNATKIALEQGRKEGIAEGITQGINQGIDQGKQQQAIAIAQQMLHDGFTTEIIARYTGLTPDAIKKITK